MARFRSRPSEIEAVQWQWGPNSDNFDEVRDFLGGADIVEMRSTVPAGWEGDQALYLLAGNNGAQGWVPVPPGHWIVRQPGKLHDHWPVENGYFQTKYERIEDA